MSYTKEELVEIASWYGVELSTRMRKRRMTEIVEGLLEKQIITESKPEEVPMSVRVKRIKEQNNG